METKAKAILIISVNLNEQLMIEDYSKQMKATSKFLIPKIRTTASFGQEASWWEKNAPDILVVSLPEDSFLQSQFILKLRTDVPKHIPLLLTCEVITTGIMQLTTVFSKIRIVRGPEDAEKFFTGLHELFAQYSPGRQQVAPRFPTNQAGKLTRSDSSEEVPIILKNMSSTGLYFEVVNDPLELGINQTVKIQVEIPGIRDYAFEGKIIWRKNLELNRIGFGLRFLDKE